jgi:hypothetical protein
VRWALGGFAVVALLATAATAAGPPLTATISGGAASAGDVVAARVRGATSGVRLRLFLVPASVAGDIDSIRDSRLFPVGVATVTARGTALRRFRVPAVTPDVYALTVCCSRGRFVRSRGVVSIRAPAPAGFGAWGRRSCSPASPGHDAAPAVGSSEVFGTSTGAVLWSLMRIDPIKKTAELESVIGQTVKIIFRMTSGLPREFYAIAPSGSRLDPVWGPSLHNSSNWQRPGTEWGAGFVFTEVGCWRIHAAGSPPAQGDVWFQVDS